MVCTRYDHPAMRQPCGSRQCHVALVLKHCRWFHGRWHVAHILLSQEYGMLYMHLCIRCSKAEQRCCLQVPTGVDVACMLVCAVGVNVLSTWPIEISSNSSYNLKLSIDLNLFTPPADYLNVLSTPTPTLFTGAGKGSITGEVRCANNSASSTVVMVTCKCQLAVCFAPACTQQQSR